FVHICHPYFLPFAFWWSGNQVISRPVSSNPQVTAPGSASLTGTWGLISPHVPPVFSSGALKGAAFAAERGRVRPSVTGKCNRASSCICRSPRRCPCFPACFFFRFLTGRPPLFRNDLHRV